jgi:hypothetical protein
MIDSPLFHGIIDPGTNQLLTKISFLYPGSAIEPGDQANFKELNLICFE